MCWGITATLLLLRHTVYMMPPALMSEKKRVKPMAVWSAAEGVMEPPASGTGVGLGASGVSEKGGWV